MMNVDLTTDPINYAALVERARDPSSGAVVLFLGTVRDFSEGKSVASLDYETYPAMARQKLTEVVSSAEQRWPLRDAGVIHRHGHLKLGDIAVAVVTAAAHRGEAFAAGQWIMDSIKQVVPIWKRENWRDGETDWVHPESAGPAEAVSHD